MTTKAEAAISVAKQRKEEVEAMLDGFYDEVEAASGKLEDALDEILKVRDRWEEIRSQVSRAHRHVTRHLRESQDRYHDGMRAVMMNKTYPGAYEERLAHYETKNITHYQINRAYEKMVEELKLFITYLNNRMFWLDQKKNWLIQEIREARFVPNEQHSIRA